MYWSAAAPPSCGRGFFVCSRLQEVLTIPGFHLHVITDRGAAPDLAAAVAAALAGGADWVQVRDKAAAARDLYDLALEMGRVCRAAGAGLLVNDRADVAVAAGAHGVHLARRSLPVAAVRPCLPPGRLVGVSVHSVAEAVEAARAGADYITFGSVFPTRSHPGAPGQGPEALAEVVRSVAIPVLAIGGITPENAPAVLATGCAGIALISAVLGAPDPQAATARLRHVLDRYEGQPRHPFPRPRTTIQGG